ncbi:MAG: TolC family protein [Pseudomonadota bacterium]
MQAFPVSRRAIAVAGALFALGGCASFSSDGGFGDVQRLTKDRTGYQATRYNPDAQAATVEKTIAPLLAKPLTVEDAVMIALLNNRNLQANYSELGIAESDLVQAGRLSNPIFSFSRLKNGDDLNIERKLMLPVIGLLTMPIARQLEQRRFEQAQFRAAGEALRIVDETRRAYFGALAAQQSSQYMEQVKTAAEASAELARRMVAAGNWSKLQQAREHAFYADAVAQLARTRQTQVAQREKLTRLMGLQGSDTGFVLPERLPDLPATPREDTDAQAQAMGNRLDILMAQKELAGLSSSLGLTKTTRFINLLDLSYLRNSGGDAPSRARGYEIELQIPLFNWGGARVAKAEAMYMQAVHRAAATAIDARSEVRESYSAYRTAYDLARHYRDEIVPLKKRISDEQMLRYNGMLIGVFELLADAREQVTSVNASIEALRDFWVADSALQAALTGNGSGNAMPSATQATAASAPAQH